MQRAGFPDSGTPRVGRFPFMDATRTPGPDRYVGRDIGARSIPQNRYKN